MMRFDACAHRYGAHARIQSDLAKWLAQWLPCLPRRAGRVLEYGAGDGLFTHHLPHDFTEVKAVDASPRMVALGRAALPAVNWEVGDAWEAAGAAPPYDAIVSASLLQWCPCPERVLASWGSLLPPGGRMLHGFYVAPTLPELATLAGPEASPLEWRSASQWRDYFKARGLHIERSEVRERVYSFENARALMRHLHGIGAVQAGHLGAGRLRRLLRDYDTEFAHPEGGVYTTWSFFRVLAVKKD